MLRANGPTGILAPSHNIVRTAVLDKYGGAGEENSPTRLVRRCVAAYFEGEHPATDPNRRAVELPWARLKLRDGPGLARSLCNASVFRQMWYKQGEASRWQLLRYWHSAAKFIAEAGTSGTHQDLDASSESKVGDKEATENETTATETEKEPTESDTARNNLIVEHLLRFGGAVAQDIRLADVTSFRAIQLERAVLDLLGMMRFEHKALELLQDVQTRLLTITPDENYALAFQAAVILTQADVC